MHGVNRQSICLRQISALYLTKVDFSSFFEQIISSRAVIIEFFPKKLIYPLSFDY
jgi:hypothetical protein